MANFRHAAWLFRRRDSGFGPGGLMPEWIRLTHNRMQIMISFVGGVMLGIAVFHMIPHSLASLGAGRIDQVMWGLMLGMLATFFLLRSFHFHQHGPADFGILAEEQAERALRARLRRTPTTTRLTIIPTHSDVAAPVNMDIRLGMAGAKQLAGWRCSRDWACTHSWMGSRCRVEWWQR
ncbi:MAG: hypothetical protein R3C56_12315 [Pirellulaceae bacterium]